MKKTILLAVIATATMFTSCKKDDKCDAGTGGNVTIVAFPKHHGKEVRPYSAWVKFNTNDSPGNSASNYDLIIDADTTENHIEIENLKCGDYYIFMTGYDTSTVAIVVGGTPYTVAESASGEINLDVAVTE